MTSTIENKEKLKALLSDVIGTDLIEECGFLDINIFRTGMIGINIHRTFINEETMKALNQICDITQITTNNKDEILIHMKPKGVELQQDE